MKNYPISTMTQPPADRFSQTSEGNHHPPNVNSFSHYKRANPDGEQDERGNLSVA